MSNISQPGSNSQEQKGIDFCKVHAIIITFLLLFHNTASQTYTRMRGMTIFNTILEEVIALLAMIGAGYLHHYLLQTTSVLLSIIWLIVHYRINELLWYGSPLLIASHVIHFVVAVFALVFTYFCAVKSPGFGSRKSLTNGSVGAAPE